MKVTYNLSRNDMSWNIYCHETLWWSGYNDDNWWNNVVPDHYLNDRNIRKCSKCDKKWALDYHSNEVKEHSK